MYLIKPIIFLLLSLYIFAFSKDYQNYNYSFFFGRQPSAKAEALGRSLVADEDNAFTAFYNPAGLTLIKGLHVGFSYASPYYLEDDANYNFIGVAYNTGGYGTISFNRFHYSLGIESITVDPGGSSTKVYTPGTSFYTLSYANEFITNLSFGINLNIYRQKMSYDETLNVYPIDVGVLKSFQFRNLKNGEHNLNLGASIKNILGSKVEFTNNIFLGNNEEVLPIIFTIGSSYQLLIMRDDYLPNMYTFGLNLLVEYQDIFNYDYLSGFKFGSEFSLFEVFFIRAGYFSFKLDPSPTNGKGRLNDFTYGFGIDIPINELIKKDIPINIVLDITTLKQPTYVTNFDKWENFSVYSLNLNWHP